MDANFDTNCCAVFGTGHALSMIMKKKFGGEWNFSERFIAVLLGMNGTEGVDPHKVAECIRHNGLIPQKDLPFDPQMTAVQYFAPNPMTQDHIFTAQEFLTQYSVNHEWILDKDDMQTSDIYIPVFKRWLKSSPIGIAVYAWASRTLEDQNNNVVYRPKGEEDVHWCVLYDIDEKYIYVWDSYHPYTKKLELGFLFERAKRYVVEKKNQGEQQVTVIQYLLQKLSWLIALLKTKSGSVGTFLGHWTLKDYD